MISPTPEAPVQPSPRDLYIGRALIGSQELAADLGRACGPNDHLVACGDGLVLPLMYVHAYPFSPENAAQLGAVASELRRQPGLGGPLPVMLSGVDVRKPPQSELYKVYLRLGKAAAGSRQLRLERAFVYSGLSLPPYDPVAVMTSSIRVAETTSEDFAMSVAWRLEKKLGASGTLAKPQLYFASDQKVAA